MIPIQHFSSGVLAEIVRRQAPSKARTAFAWQIAVGPAIARSTSVEAVDGVLHVHPRDARWGQEIRRAAPTILQRMRHLLGDQALRSIKVAGEKP
jgi:predicted nucleic acid-binding Zn ribbon protein